MNQLLSAQGQEKTRITQDLSFYFYFFFHLFSEAAFTDHTSDSSVTKEAYSLCAQMKVHNTGVGQEIARARVGKEWPYKF